MQHHKYSLTELENMMPFEREIYLGLLEQHIREENEKVEREKNRQREAIMAAQKKLQKGSAWEHLDADGDGVISDEEIAMEERMIQLEDMRSDMENEDKKQDAQRNMAWFALSGMLLYPFAVVIAVWFGLDKAASILGDMAAVYFVSVAAIVAAFYGKEAIAQKKNSSIQVKDNRQ